MKNKVFLLLLMPILIIFYLLYQKIWEPDDISNIPHSLVPQFKKFDANSRFKRLQKEQKGDYYNLMDIDFNFEAKPEVCENHEPFLLILVHSAVRNFEKRKTIRETWGRSGDSTRLVFLLGSSKESETKARIREESKIFSDLVIGSFLDTYKNLTYKHMMGFKYAVYHCKAATYILKTDDDVFVNTPYLIEYIKTNISKYGAEKLLMCNVWAGADVARSHRSKYRFSFEEVPYKKFPIYCSGWFILYSPDVVHDIYALAQYSEYFWVDDVFITGILAERLRIPHFNVRNLVISKGRMSRIVQGVCDATEGLFLLGRPNIEEEVVRKLWTCAVLSDREIIL